MRLWDEGPAFCGAWNFGPLNTEIWTVEQIVQKVCALWGAEAITWTLHAANTSPTGLGLMRAKREFV